MLIITIPLVANVLLSRKLYAFVISAPLGVCILWVTMVSVEVRAPDSDLDFIFALACLGWAVILILAYALLSAVFAGVSSLRHRK